MEMWEKLWEQIVVVFPIVAYLVFFKVEIIQTFPSVTQFDRRWSYSAYH